MRLDCRGCNQFGRPKNPGNTYQICAMETVRPGMVRGIGQIGVENYE
jgi:hypothetical protein